MKQITAIAISGGIDSLVAAFLLKKAGHNIIGIHFLTGYEKTTTAPNHSSTHPVSNVADQLGIPFEVIDTSQDFKKTVVDYFTRTYQDGKTPNPCLVCNPAIKFGTVLNHARSMGATCLATGHYAKIKKDDQGFFHLFRGKDPEKEQSYFLAFLSQDQLAAACFPLGGLTKAETKKLAKENGLTPVVKNESQDVCFIKKTPYHEFLSLHKNFETKPGLIEDINGKILGRHDGLHRFTIGQRRGINCPASEPYYVVRIDMQRNRLIVGLKKDLLSKKCKVVRINWISNAPDSPVHMNTRVRYRSQPVASVINPTGRDSATVTFKTPQPAITPGQGAVFYKDDEVLGGGFIESENQ